MPRSLALLRSPLLLHVRLLIQVAGGLSVVALILAVSRSAALVLAMISSGQLIGALADAVVDGDASRRAWTWLVVFAATFVAAALLGAVSRGVEELVSARYLGGYQDLLLDTATTPHVVDGLQSASGAMALGRAADALQHWLFLRGVSGIWGMVSNRLAGVGALVIVAEWRWWIALLLLAGWLVLSRAIARWRSIVFDDTEQRAIPMRHRAAYLNRLLAARSSGKEVRLFGLADWLLGSYVELSRAAMTVVAGRRGEGVRRTVWPLALLLLMHVGAFALLISDVADGLVSVAGLAILVQAVLGMSAFGRQDDDETSTGRTATELARLVAFRTSLGLPFPASPPERSVPSDVHAGPASIEIRGVRFGYPGRSEPVLEGLDLTIEAGECVAIVGANGAGKSTLLSLLCGLWRPEAGTVRIDGLDPAVDRSARSRVAPIFQTFLRLPLSAAENITAGNAWRAGTQWQRAAVDASADHVVAGLSEGAETVLSSQFFGGTDLSGGQWQRMALARALTAVHAGTGLLALDEPTAALDVRAEMALFESVLRDRGRATTLLITHRLSSVQHADRIVVLGRTAGGGGARVIENGSHQELIKLGGSYAEMFNLQAARFNGAGR